MWWSPIPYLFDLNLRHLFVFCFFPAARTPNIFKLKISLNLCKTAPWLTKYLTTNILINDKCWKLHIMDIKWPRVFSSLGYRQCPVYWMPCQQISFPSSYFTHWWLSYLLLNTLRTLFLMGESPWTYWRNLLDRLQIREWVGEMWTGHYVLLPF